MSSGRHLEVADLDDLDRDHEEHDAEHDRHPLLEEMHDLVAEQSQNALKHEDDSQPEPERHVDENVDRLGAEDGGDGDLGARRHRRVSWRLGRLARDRQPLQQAGQYHRPAEGQARQR